MSSTTKTAIALIVLILVILVGWLWYINYSGNSPTAAQQYAPVQQTLNNQPPGIAGGVTAPSDSSDAAIDQDMTSIGGQVNGLNADSANAGVNSAVPQLQ